MASDGKELGRRDFLKVGAAIAGAAVLQPWGPLLQRLTSPLGSAEVAREVAHLVKSSPRSKARQPNVVLIVLDTVRADHLSCYGYTRDTTPNIDAFATGARLYKSVLAPSSWTLPTHASMFTGLAARTHGVSWLHRFLDQRFPTLAEQLAACGYQTAGLACNLMLRPQTGIDRGFQFYEVPDHGAASMHARVAHWFRRHYDPRKPFLLFMNYIEAHQPYRPPLESLHFTSRGVWKRWSKLRQDELLFDYTLTGNACLAREDIAELESLYDDEIRYVDQRVGEMLAFLHAARLDESTLVIITADHGEHFGEHHYMDHAYSLYEPLVRVPLIVRYGDRFRAGVEDRPVQNHDIYPTILELAGVEWQPTADHTCANLLQPLSATRCCISEYLDPMPAPLERVSFTYPDADCSRFVRKMLAIQQENMKLIRWFRDSVAAEYDFELYDIAADPLETQNLAGQRPSTTCELSALLDAWGRACNCYVATPMPRYPQIASPSTLRAMRGLGYIQ